MAFTYSPKIVTDGLVFAVDAANTKSYPGSGTTWKDLSGNGNDGTLTNGPTFDSGNGGSIVFDGTDDYISFGNPAEVQFIYTNEFSLEAWVNPNTLSGFKHIIGKTYVNYRLAHSGTNISFRLDANTITTSGGSLVVGEWTHIIATWDPLTQTAKVYQNGVQVSSVTNITCDWTNTSANFQLGNSPGENYYFDGKITLGKAYSKTLTPSEITQNYNALKSRFGL